MVKQLGHRSNYILQLSPKKIWISHLHISKHANNLPSFSNNATSSYNEGAKI